MTREHAFSLPEIYRDRWILVIDKPSGLHAQAPAGGGPNAYDRVRAKAPRAALHHRLDTPASGLMLFALHPRANRPLSRMFQSHEIRREYLAIVLGDPGFEGRWDAPVGGRSAGTRWRQLATGGGMAALAVTLETGRKHQIRVHAAGAGHPLIGDRRHGGSAGRAWPRLALHARSLALDHPITGAPMDLTAPLPADLQGLARRAGLSDDLEAGGGA